MPPQVARRVTVHGRVQGVWFRASTAEIALSLGVRGHARNQADGTVEVLALGDPQAVEQLIEWLWQGPPLARVTAVVVEDVDAGKAAVATAGFTTG